MTQHTLHLGDCLDVLRTLPDNSVDSVVTDPPYGLSFMGKRWDYDVPSIEVWAECLRVLKPGGHLLAFAGTRTQHRMAVRIEDAGFEIRDMIAWVYSTGFPKSLDVSKAIDAAAGAVREVVGKSARHTSRPFGANEGDLDFGTFKGSVPDITAPATDLARQWQGWGTALKPALEPITVARKPLAGTVAENVTTWGTGAINVDGCRVGTRTENESRWSKTGSKASENRSMSGANYARQPKDEVGTGRFPANLIHDGSDEVVGLFPQTTSGALNQESVKAENNIYGRHSGYQDPKQYAPDSGSAARFFACFPRESGYGEGCQDQSHQSSSVPDAALTLSLQSAAASIAQRAVAIWPHLAGTLSSGQTEPSTAVTPNESKAIDETAMQAIATIASGFSRESQQERHTPCGSLVRSAATIDQTGTMTTTISLFRSGGFVANATFSITPTILERGEAGSRFRYCAKASKEDRDEGCDALPFRESAEMVDRDEDSAGIKSPRAGAGRKNGARNFHPTVKPTDLMRYLCRLVTPPGGTVLDPFMGSGSTGKGALEEGFRFIGIERDPEYFKIAEVRIPPRQPRLF
jgi:hypothetical protein